MAEQFLDREDQPCCWYGDSAYGTGDLRGVITDAGHDAVIKPKPLQAPVDGGFTVDDFTVDEPAGTVTCPAANTRPITPGRAAIFGALCRDCPLRAQCTTSTTGRTLHLHDRDNLLRRARAQWKTDPQLRENYRTFRPNVERVISQIANRGGRRLKLRYRGTNRNNAWLKRRTAALNLRNLVGRGLTARRVPGPWPPEPNTCQQTQTCDSEPADSPISHPAPPLEPTSQISRPHNPAMPDPQPP